MGVVYLYGSTDGLGRDGDVLNGNVRVVHMITIPLEFSEVGNWMRLLNSRMLAMDL